MLCSSFAIANVYHEIAESKSFVLRNSLPFSLQPTAVISDLEVFFTSSLSRFFVGIDEEEDDDETSAATSRSTGAAGVDNPNGGGGEQRKDSHYYY